MPAPGLRAQRPRPPEQNEITRRALEEDHRRRSERQALERRSVLRGLLLLALLVLAASIVRASLGRAFMPGWWRP